MGGWDLEEVRRLFNFLEFRTLWDRLLEATGEDQVADEMATAGPLRRGRRPAPARRRCRGRAARRLGGQATPVALAAGWEGREGRSAIDGLALRRGAAPGRRRGRGAVDRRAACWPTRRSWPPCRRPGRPRRGAHVSAHDAKALMRGLAVMGVDFSTPRTRHRHRRLPGRSGRRPVPARGPGLALRRHRPAGPRRPARRPARPRRAVPSTCQWRRAGGRRRWPGWSSRSARAMSARGLSPLYDEIERPLVRVLARMEEAGVRVDED